MTSTAPVLVAAAVMAGGRSSRMGRDKAFVRWRGTRLIDRQLATLRLLRPVELLISGRSDAAYGAADARVVTDVEPECGPLGGVASLLAASTASHVLVLAVDLPAMTTTFLARLVSACSAETGAVARTRRGWEPLAAVYPQSLRPLISARLARRELALQQLVADAVGQGQMQPVPVSLPEENLFVNVNTPADLR